MASEKTVTMPTSMPPMMALGSTLDSKRFCRFMVRWPCCLNCELLKVFEMDLLSWPLMRAHTYESSMQVNVSETEYVSTRSISIRSLRRKGSTKDSGRVMNYIRPCCSRRWSD